MQNRYLQLIGLTIGLAILFAIVLWLVVFSLGIADRIPLAGLLFTAVLAAGVLVYKFFADRIA